VFNPIPYFELPELFMEFICSMTGKSPSTTGAGSELKSQLLPCQKSRRHVRPKWTIG
jgi:hypothetical protein